LNDLPPINVFPTEDTKAAAFAETKTDKTYVTKKAIFKSYKLNSLGPTKFESWLDNLVPF